MPRKDLGDFDGVLVKDRKVIYSELGFFSTLYNQENLSTYFVQDSISFSASAGTIRGMHFQKFPYSQAKLINVLQGSIQDFFVDIQPDSKTFLSYGSIKISAKEPTSLFLPRGFAHGFITLEPNTLISYKLDSNYFPESEETLLWNDLYIGIKWPHFDDYILSEKDKAGKKASELFLLP